jgi:hypothetical protein
VAAKPATPAKPVVLAQANTKPKAAPKKRKTGAYLPVLGGLGLAAIVGVAAGGGGGSDSR